MLHAMDVKVNVKPVFSNMVHSGVWEGPCRVGTPEQLSPSYEIRAGKEHFAIWTRELRDNLCKYANLMEPAYIEFDETFVVLESEFEKLAKDAPEVDLYLITYRVPGIERFHKPISMINLGPTPIDLVAFYRDTGSEAYMAHDYEEFNQLIKLLQVRKAIANTKILILSATEQIPASVNSSIPDLYGLYQRYGIRNNRMTFRNVFDQMEKMEATSDTLSMVENLVNGATESRIKAEWIQQDVRYYEAVRALMEKFGCNAFTTSCKELCASRYPMQTKCTPCLTHSLLKDDRIPSSCEEDLNVLMATMVLMYLTEQSVFMGNPMLVPKGTRTLKQMGMSDLDQLCDEDILEIHHAVPGLKMEGFEQPEMPYFLGHFTQEGWGTKVQVDMAARDTKVVTMGRFNRRGDSMIVARAEILGCEFRETYCSPAIFYRVEGGVREFRQALAKGCYGHHLAVVYGDHVEEVKDLGEVAGFDVQVHH